jgi:aryl-alcohol dehydrogenase-like predicted oxidoreductase
MGPGPVSGHPDYIRNAVFYSLRRLQTDYIDLYTCARVEKKWYQLRIHLNPVAEINLKFHINPFLMAVFRLPDSNKNNNYMSQGKPIPK